MALPTFLLLLIHLTLLPSALSTTCSITTNTTLSNCTPLPTLSSTLHWSYNPTNSTLSIAFTAAPPSPSGWVAWAINPTSAGMLGAQALLAHRHPNGSLSLSTFNLSSYAAITPSPLSFHVYNKRATFKDGSLTIFADVESKGGKINHVWQVGPGFDHQGLPLKHEFKAQNLQAKGTLDLSNGGGGKPETETSNAGVRKKNIHGLLNAISWGFLFPVGGIIARYLRTFKSADPTWFYVHATCQVSAYAIGVAGWATGLQLGRESVGIVYTRHRYIGIALFCLASIQIFALFLRPNKDHKYRFYWNIYHHSIGYAILVLGILNVFKGIHILEPEKKWKSTYVTALIVLGGVAVLLEAFTWIVVLKRKSTRSTKPYA